MEENQADSEVAMEHYLTENESVWTTWVSEDIADKVKKALKAL
jgi:glycine betaine/proline transport system substrate-binding protein